MRAGSLPRLTPDASGETVLGWARIFARRFAPFGALEREDLVGLACLRFYAVALPRWQLQLGDFGAFAAAHMRGAMGEALRREALGKGDAQPRARAPRATQNRYNHQTHYLRTHGLQTCDGCGAFVGRGHGARRCDACASPTSLRQRQRRAGRRQPCACGCGMLVLGRWKHEHVGRVRHLQWVARQAAG